MRILVDFLQSQAHYAAFSMTMASVLALVAIGSPRHAALRQWRWLWLYLFLSAGFNLLPMLLNGTSLRAGLLTATLGRMLYMPPLLLGLGAIVGHERYRRYAYVGAAILTLQLVIARLISRGATPQAPVLRTTLSYVLILAVAAPGVIARLPRIRQSILRDGPMIAIVATMLAYGSQLIFPTISAGMSRTSVEYAILLWVRNGIWIACYALWWYAFRQARRQARSA